MLKNSILVLVLIFSNLTWSQPSLQDLKKKSKSVAVEIELESVLGIDTYEIEIRQPGVPKALNFQQKESVFSVTLDVGKYSMRTRMKTKAETGPWSNWVSLVAPPDEVVLNAIDYRYFVTKKDRFAPINMGWNFATGAERYRLWFEKIYTDGAASEKLNKIKKIETKDNTYIARMPEGQYKIGVQSISRNDIASNVVYYKELFVVQQSSLPKIAIKKGTDESYSWDQVPDANVKVELYKKAFFASDYERLSSEIVNFATWKIPVGLKPGEYKIEFQFVSDNVRNGEIEILKFVKRPTEEDFAKAIKE